MTRGSDAAPARMLFVGNSYTARNELPRLVADIAASSDRPRAIAVQSIIAGGASLRRHWNAGVAQRTLDASHWDYVVLQEQSTLPVKNAQRYHENVRLFAKAIAQHGARAVLYLTWCRQQAPQSQARICDAVDAIGAEVGAIIAPVGRAWQAALDANVGLPLYLPDGSHPTVVGSYLAACTFVATLFGARPADFRVADRLAIERGVAATLHDIAWAVRGEPARDALQQPSS